MRTVKSCVPGIPTLMPSRADDDQCDDGGQQAGCTEEITYNPSTHRAGNAGCSARPVVTAACIFFCRRANFFKDMGCGQRPAFPAPSLIRRGHVAIQLGRRLPRERGRVLPVFKRSRDESVFLVRARNMHQTAACESVSVQSHFANEREGPEPAMLRSMRSELPDVDRATARFVTQRNCRRHIRTWLCFSMSSRRLGSSCRASRDALPTIICSRCSMGAAQRGSVIRSGRLRSVSLKNQQCSAIASYAILNTKLDFRESLR